MRWSAGRGRRVRAVRRTGRPWPWLGPHGNAALGGTALVPADVRSSVVAELVTLFGPRCVCACVRA